MPDVLAFKGVSLSKYLSNIALSTEGISGIPLGVSSSILFVIDSSGCQGINGILSLPRARISNIDPFSLFRSCMDLIPESSAATRVTDSGWMLKTARRSFRPASAKETRTESFLKTYHTRRLKGNGLIRDAAILMMSHPRSQAPMLLENIPLPVLESRPASTYFQPGKYSLDLIGFLVCFPIVSAACAQVHSIFLFRRTGPWPLVCLHYFPAGIAL